MIAAASLSEWNEMKGRGAKRAAQGHQRNFFEWNEKK